MANINVRAVQGPGYTEAKKHQPTEVPRPEQSRRSHVPEGDRVTLSAAGRALADMQKGDAADAGETGGIDRERLMQIRTRIMQGAYDSLDVMEEVARRLLANGRI